MSNKEKLRSFKYYKLPDDFCCPECKTEITIDKSGYAICYNKDCKLYDNWWLLWKKVEALNTPKKSKKPLTQPIEWHTHPDYCDFWDLDTYFKEGGKWELDFARSHCNNEEAVLKYRQNLGFEFCEGSDCEFKQEKEGNCIFNRKKIEEEKENLYSNKPTWEDW